MVQNLCVCHACLTLGIKEPKNTVETVEMHVNASLMEETQLWRDVTFR